MLVMKCSRLLRFGSSPSVKLLKAVIGICSTIMCQVLWLPLGLKMAARLALLLFRSTRSGRSCRRHRQIGTEHVDGDFPFAICLFFPNLAVLARILGPVFHRHRVGAD